MNVKINRGQDQVNMKFVTEMTEDAQGCVMNAGYDQRMAEDTIKMRYHFTDAKVTIVSSQQGKIHVTDADPVAPSHIGRAAARRRFIHALDANQTEIGSVPALALCAQDAAACVVAAPAKLDSLSLSRSLPLSLALFLSLSLSLTHTHTHTLEWHTNVAGPLPGFR